MRLQVSKCKQPTLRDQRQFSRPQIALAVRADFPEHNSVRSAKAHLIELAFRLRCYVAADFDWHWKMEKRELPLAAFRCSRSHAEQVAWFGNSDALALRHFFSSRRLVPSIAVRLAFRLRCYVAAALDMHLKKQRPARPLAAFRLLGADAKQVVAMLGTMLSSRRPKHVPSLIGKPYLREATS